MKSAILSRWLLSLYSVNAAASRGILNTSSTSWTLLYQNNLNLSDDANHIGALMTDGLSLKNGIDACAEASERPLTVDVLRNHRADFKALFRYFCLSGRLLCPALLAIENGMILAGESTGFIELPGARLPEDGRFLPQLCSQSGAGNMSWNSGPTSSNRVSVTSGNSGNTYIGYRNEKSFRFLGVRYAPKAERFVHSRLDNSTDKTYDSTQYGPSCVQDYLSTTSEDCQFLNIQTPYLPRADSSTLRLRPVLFHIHGGALVTGSGSAWQADGGNLAAREDIVVVNINYRLGTYGFFAVPNTSYTGNYGLGDIINALKWTQTNIAYFGGDPSKISIVGESAGAALVRALIGSSKAQGLFSGAVAMSNLGGAVDLGEDGDYGTGNTFYYTIEQSFEQAGATILRSAGCDTTESTLSRIRCLETYNEPFTSLATQTRWLVQDGEYVTSPYLEVGRPGSVAKIPFITGVMENDGASFIGYNKTCKDEAACLASNLQISHASAQSVIESKLFPWPDAGNLAADAFNVSQRVRTDDTFRCVDQASVYAAATTKSMGSVWYYQMNRGNGGFNPNGVPDGSISGNSPGIPYYRVHSGDMLYAFGNMIGMHGAPDLRATELLTSYLGAFVRTGDPNPDLAMLKARGYMNTYRAVTAMGRWEPVKGEDGPILMFDDPPALQNGFVDTEQCKWLNYSLDYFVTDP